MIKNKCGCVRCVGIESFLNSIFSNVSDSELGLKEKDEPEVIELKENNIVFFEEIRVLSRLLHQRKIADGKLSSENEMLKSDYKNLSMKVNGLKEENNRVRTRNIELERENKEMKDVVKSISYMIKNNLKP